MRKVFAPVVPMCSLCGVTTLVLIVAVPITKVAVEMIFGVFGY